MKKSLLVVALTVAFLPLPGRAQESVEQKIENLQKQVDELKTEVSRQRPPDAPATSLFGYGEFNYNRYRDADRTTRADLRRFVIGFGHRFDDRLSFNSELEVEHGVVSSEDRGEAELEQAYLPRPTATPSAVARSVRTRSTPPCIRSCPMTR